jgi:hypothetical protein
MSGRLVAALAYPLLQACGFEMLFQESKNKTERLGGDADQSTVGGIYPRKMAGLMDNAGRTQGRTAQEPGL